MVPNFLGTSRSATVCCLAKMLIMVTILGMGTCRQIQTSILMESLRETNGWVYLGKMSFRQGTVDVKMKTERLTGQSNLKGATVTINFIPDSQWQKQKQEKCKLSPNFQTQIVLEHQLLLQAFSISEHTINIPASSHQQMYYIVMKDCAKSLSPQYDNKGLIIQINMEIINNGKFMGEEEDHWLIIPVIIGIGLWMIMTDKYFLRSQFQSDPDYAKMMLFGAIATNISSLMWRSFGYIIYRNFGSNYLFFHIIYLFMHAVSETMVIGLLVLISMGWSLNFLTGPRINIAIPIVSFLAVFNIILSLMTQLNNTAHDMHHSFDATSGYILIILRIIVALGFIFSALYTIKESRYRIRQFLKKFLVMGSLYICAMPIIVFLANNLFKASFRNQFVFISVEIIKSICNISLMYMVSSSRSEYNKLSYKNSSFMPNQTGLF